MIQTFLEKAVENLDIAQVAFDNGAYNAVANRAYYAAFQSAIAALAREGITHEDNPHSWVQAQFSGILIQRRKLFSSLLKSHLLDMQRMRDDADYSTQMISKSKARTQLRQATEFVSSIQKVMAP
jgi:uncharacterized protein (UPF0332 family)